MKESARIEWLDIVRSIAILGAVMCHAVEGIYPFNVEYISSISLFSKIFAFSAFSAGRLGVPLFLLISGYLLLDRNYDKDSCVKFWKTNLVGLVITVELWIIIYNIYLVVFGKQVLSVSELIKQMLFVQSVNMNHMWYMPMIIGIYVFIPIVANALSNVDFKILYFPMAIVFGYTFLVPIINVLFRICGKELIYSKLSLDFSGGSYGYYLAMGYLIKSGWLKSVKNSILAGVGSLSFVAVVGLQCVAFSKGINYAVWYDCGLLFISAVCLFEFISRSRNIWWKPYIQILSKYSFAIYLIHNLILIMFIPYIKTFMIMNPVKVVAAWAVSIGISLISAYIIGKIPRVKELLFFIRD